MERLYPAEPTALGMIPHDGVIHPGAPQSQAANDPRRTLVMACCDPAVGLLAAALAGTAGFRLLALQRPSRTALELLGQGLVHAAGVHLCRADEPGGNGMVVRGKLGAGYSLLRVARWEEGIALAPERGVRSIRAAVHSNLRWIGREDGSGARQCLDELLGSRRRPPGAWPPTTAASPRPFVAAGPMPASASAWSARRPGWTFSAFVKRPTISASPPALPATRESRALQEIVRSPLYRKALGELPGYDSTETGQLQQVT